MIRGTRQLVIGGATRYLDLRGTYDNRFDAAVAADRLRARHWVRVIKFASDDYRVYALLDENNERSRRR